MQLETYETSVKRSARQLTVFIRPDTTDIKVIKEVLQQCVYEKPSIEFFIESTDVWLDLGGNIGTFSLLALARGAKVLAYEPETENFALMRKNVAKNFKNTPHFRAVQKAVGVKAGTLDLYLCKGAYNKYRHTLHPVRGRETVPVSVVTLRSVLRKNPDLTAIKMDIEGAEIELMEAMTPRDYQGIRKMVVEYSFDVDRSIPRFLRIMKQLQTYFPHVHWTKVKPDEEFYNYFPAATLVFCYF